MSEEEKEQIEKENGSEPDESEEEDPMGEIDQERIQKEMARMLTSVKDMMLYNMSVLASQAWHHLGLVPIPGSDGMEKDISQAKLAIDLYEANLKVLEPRLEADQAKELKRSLMDLHMNYVNKSKKE
ncbi:MAG: DUF1844 domain-containing protein [Thermoplasmatota archaeon]